MLNIPNPDYNELEQRVGLLLHIGRDIRGRGESGFNIAVELTGKHLGRIRISGEERYRAYEWLQEKGLISVRDPEHREDMDGETTFVKVDLTAAGKELYEEAERSYGDYLNSLSDNFS